MFSGIIQALGSLNSVENSPDKKTLCIDSQSFTNQDIHSGQSIGIDGICLTLTKKNKNLLYFDVLDETIRCTHLRDIQIGKTFNLERALRLGDEVGGHLVTGHIDDIGTVDSVTHLGNDVVLKIAFDAKWCPFLISKGSIAINGVSLTVVESAPIYFTVHLIPLTLEKTNLSLLKKGDLVNLEFDQIAKYLYKFNSSN